MHNGNFPAHQGTHFPVWKCTVIHSPQGSHACFGHAFSGVLYLQFYTYLPWASFRPTTFWFKATVSLSSSHSVSLGVWLKLRFSWSTSSSSHARSLRSRSISGHHRIWRTREHLRGKIDCGLNLQMTTFWWYLYHLGWLRSLNTWLKNLNLAKRINCFS